MSWETASGALKLGESYRISLSVRAPYTPSTINALRGAFAIQAALRGDIVIEKTEYGAPLFSAHGIQEGPWPFWVYFHVAPKAEIAQAGIDPRIVGVLIAAAVAGIIVMIASQKIEHLVVASIGTVGSETRATASLFLNPLVLLAALAGLYLWTRRN